MALHLNNRLNGQPCKLLTLARRRLFLSIRPGGIVCRKEGRLQRVPSKHTGTQITWVTP